ncbi:phospho-sugar mutase [Marinicrinis sediminis]|uniref:Phosphoglucomutase n=1 Tax=Marinicrinis sediminis TaxID=1652465 RepID=A0ABW5RB97_9BACL
MSMTVVDQYQQWMNDPAIDEETKTELRRIEGNEKEIEDRFFKELEFGTGGLRGIIGAGTNRMNKYTVGKATQGLTHYLNKQFAHVETPKVAIAYDSRHQSPEFALEAALVLAAGGIKAYVFEALRPTPQLSFAVRELKAQAGIVITASHNPPEYNGYKVYNQHGGQLVVDEAKAVIAEIQQIAAFSSIQKLSREAAEEQGSLHWIGEEMDEKYIEAVTSVSLMTDQDRAALEDLKVVFTALHGTGSTLVPPILKAIGCKQVHSVAEQADPDADFSTVKSPNPEERDAFAIALRDAQEYDADLIIGTDPDADRMGAVVKDQSGAYQILSGNQSGAIMAEYLLSRMKERGTLPENGMLIKTIVTSELGASIAKHYQVETMDTLTGFKYIGEKMTQFEQDGSYFFLFGYEESYGYLAGTYARDKDAIIASMLIAEAAAYYKAQGKSLVDVLNELYAQHGYYKEKLQSITLKGKSGMELIQQIMDDWRQQQPAEIGPLQVAQVEDYAQGLHGLPRENVLKFKCADGSWFCLRPSGTEPKIKIYFSVCRDSEADSAKTMQVLEDYVMKRVTDMTSTST